MNGIRILIADNDMLSLASFEESFKRSGFTVITAHSGEEVIQKTKDHLPHIIVLDIALPGKDGIETCIELRSMPKFRKMIIVFYTSRHEDYAQIAAFNSGADDYVIKPVKWNVLKSRLQALLKRFDVNVESIARKNGNGISIDRDRYIVSRDGEEVILPRKEFELLSLLYSSPRKVFTREEISKVVWGYDTQAHNRTIDVHVRKLRLKLGKRYIKTVKGVGYSMLP